MKILIDNGHGSNTPGKCSPDRTLREYAYTREIAKRVVDELKARGYDAERVTPEETDVSLSERCKRINNWCKKLGAKNVISISIHNDAAGADDKWHSARGFNVKVSLNASASSKKLAQIFTTHAMMMGITGNRCIPKEKYWTQNLAMCRDTNCPAILTENLFQDNKEDVAFLLSEKGKKAIVDLHVESIIQYLG